MMSSVGGRKEATVTMSTQRGVASAVPAGVRNTRPVLVGFYLAVQGVAHCWVAFEGGESAWRATRGTGCMVLSACLHDIPYKLITCWHPSHIHLHAVVAMCAGTVRLAAAPPAARAAGGPPGTKQKARQKKSKDAQLDEECCVCMEVRAR